MSGTANALLADAKFPWGSFACIITEYPIFIGLGITWDNVAPVRSFADIIEDIYTGDFRKDAEDYISRSRHLLDIFFDHLSDHVNHVKHLFEGVDRLRMMGKLSLLDAPTMT